MSPVAEPTGPSHQVLFRVPFRSTMRNEDTRYLRSAGLTLNLHAKHAAVRPPPGAARLDFDSGLFLVRGEADEEWALEGRTWGGPPPELVGRWERETVFVASQVDPEVPLP